MRLSADPVSADYAGPVRARVYLNDREVRHCRLADEERGYVIVELHDAAGRLVVEGDKIATQIRHGAVRIELVDATR